MRLQQLKESSFDFLDDVSFETVLKLLSTVQAVPSQMKVNLT